MVEKLRRENIAAYKKLIDECFGSGSDLERYESYCENAAYTIYVVKDGSEIVGSVTGYAIELFTFDFQPSLMLFNVAVSPNHRGKGVARALFEHIIADAKARGYRQISLTCLESAHAAHKLYEAVGFKRAGSIKFEMSLTG